MNLPTLTGATGQLLDIAEGDRRSVLAQLDEAITKNAPNAELAAEMAELFREVALRQTTAGWWMNHVAARSIARDVAELFTAEDRARHTAIRNRAA